MILSYILTIFMFLHSIIFLFRLEEVFDKTISTWQSK